MRNWYKTAQESESDYDTEWRDIIENHARSNPYPFSEWFDGSNRVYIPFSGPAGETGNADPDVENILKDYGYTITDYRAGYCQDSSGRTMRIGKLLPRLMEKALQELQVRYDNGEIYNLQREQEETTQYFQDVINTFQNSALRTSKGESQYYVVISQDPHDVAQMSTGRNWSSCMTLGEGSYHENVFCDVAEGTLIAYLIYGNDKEIRHPLARILIRRFANANGESVAIPENSVYGNTIEGFSSTVKKWLNQRQNVGIGFYKRKGGGYSDSLGDSEFFMPKDPQGLLDIFNLKDTHPIVEYIVTDKLKEEYVNQLHMDEYSDNEDDLSTEKSFPTQEEAQEYVDEQNNTEMGSYEASMWIDEMAQEATYRWREDGEMDEETIEAEEEKFRQQLEDMDRFEIKESTIMSAEQIREKAVQEILKQDRGAFSLEDIKRVKDFVFRQSDKYGILHNRDLKRKIVEKYPEVISDDNLQHVDDTTVAEYIANLPDGPDKERQKEGMINNIHDYIKQFMDEVTLSNSRFEPSEYNQVSTWVLNPLEKLGPIKEDTIQLLVNLVEKTTAAANYFIAHNAVGQEIRYAQEYKRWLIRDVANLFSRTGADTPTVQNFYQSQLEDWDLISSIDTLGWPIARLGENGRQFIPFIQEQLQKCEQMLNRTDASSASKKLYERLKEKYLYVIDALENGTGLSRKYRWSRSYSNWYKKSIVT